MIFHNDHFYDDFDDILENLQDTDELDDDDDCIIEYQDCDLQPVCRFEPGYIAEFLCEDRDDEDGNALDKVAALFRKYCDVESINMHMPKLWYPVGPWKTFDLKTLLDKEDSHAN